MACVSSHRHPLAHGLRLFLMLFDPWLLDECRACVSFVSSQSSVPDSWGLRTGMWIPVGWEQVLSSAPQLLLQTKECNFGGVGFPAGLQSSGLGSFYKRLVVPVTQGNLSEWALQSVPRSPSFCLLVTALGTETTGLQLWILQRCHVSQRPSPSALAAFSRGHPGLPREGSIPAAPTSTDPVLLPHNPSQHMGRGWGSRHSTNSCSWAGVAEGGLIMDGPLLLLL